MAVRSTLGEGLQSVYGTVGVLADTVGNVAEVVNNAARGANHIVGGWADEKEAEAKRNKSVRTIKDETDLMEIHVDLAKRKSKAEEELNALGLKYENGEVVKK